ncbi:MAG TPA: DUF3551 domain-containing protein [Bradyrhizobium sp.]|nr:DUF3551 domain-containing protein [Bradyrhizobium sp.]
MKTIFGLNAIVLAALALLSTTSGASAKNYQYCELDFSGMRDCRFETMEQCVAMISGRGGSCMRDPYPVEAGTAYASVPAGHRHRRRPRAN